MKKKLLEKTQDELVTAYTQYYEEEMHDLMSSVAHDVKNPLGIIELSLGLMEDKVGKLLDGEDEKLQAKIKNFFNNINVGLERCQDILDSSLDVKRTDMPNTPSEIEDLKTYVDKFYVFAKPKLKRKRINFDNAIEESVKLTTVPHQLARVLIEAINYISLNIEAPEGAFMELTYADKFIFKVSPKNESHVKISHLDTSKNDVFNNVFEKFKTNLSTEFTIENQDNCVVATLGLI
jgi:light-regulated signal transduction histidine kinase (bacteriophytochrome)